jgi:predicted transcriptional regulator
VTLEEENKKLRRALKMIAEETVVRPTSYGDLISGEGVRVPTRAAQIAKETLGELHGTIKVD